jgi:HTH-type transcriptional regulator/antitoxin HigA
MKAMKIKTSAEYEAALEEVDALMGSDLTAAQSEHYDRLVAAIEQYESEHFPIEPPDPVAAVQFRMEQGGLKQKDLVQYFGDKAKVSKFLSGKLSLSKAMIQSLHKGLGIPLESLMGLLPSKEAEVSPIDWERFPVKEIRRRGWLTLSGRKTVTADLIESALKAAYPFIVGMDLQPIYLRSTNTQNRTPDPYAVMAWQLQLMKLATAEKLKEKFDLSVLTSEFGRELAKLSYLDQGPRLAKEFLNKNGIHLIILEHLPRTYLDGAAMMLPSQRPVIGLTLRMDRLDNFWFNLLHEVAHISLHISKNRLRVITESLDHVSSDPEEIEANRWAADALIPEEIWRACGFDSSTTESEILAFSKAIRIHPAITAGRIRHESGNYTLYSRLLGKGLVRPIFESDKKARKRGTFKESA